MVGVIERPDDQMFFDSFVIVDRREDSVFREPDSGFQLRPYQPPYRIPAPFFEFPIQMIHIESAHTPDIIAAFLFDHEETAD
jgi:hypothetical protein